MKRIISKIVQLRAVGQYYGANHAFYEMLSAIFGQKTSLGKRLFYKKHELAKQYLREQYSEIITKYKEQDYSQGQRKNPIVWVFWWQGEQAMPDLVSLCYQSICHQFPQTEVVLISKENIGDYLTIPSGILEKVAKGAFSLTILSDYVRLSLLAKYGGLWLDSTIFVSNCMEAAIKKYPFFSVNYGNHALDYHVCKGKWMTSVLGIAEPNTGMQFCQELFEAYFLREETQLTYLVLDCVLALAYEELPEFQQAVDALPVENTKVGLLDAYMTGQLHSLPDEAFFANQSFHKLSYKTNYGSKLDLLQQHLPAYQGDTDAKNSEKLSL